MTAYVPSWLQYGPESNASSISSGLSAAGKFAEVNEQHEKDQNEALNAGVSAIQNMRQLQQQKQQFAQSQQLAMLKLQTDKQQTDRQFQLDQQDIQNKHAMAQQQLDLQTNQAAQQFQWNQQYQQRVKALTAPKLEGAEASANEYLGGQKAGGAGMDYNSAAVQALQEIGPPPGETMTGFGTSIKAMQLAPAPIEWQRNPDTGEIIGSIYGNKFTASKNAPDTTTKDKQADEKLDTEKLKIKASFVNDYIFNNRGATTQDAVEAWNEGVDGGDVKPPSADSVNSRYKILEVQ